MPNENIENAIDALVAGNAADFKNAINDALVDKAADTIDLHRDEYVSRLFAEKGDDS